MRRSSTSSTAVCPRGQGIRGHIRVFDVDIDNRKVSNSKVHADGFAPALTGGMRADVEEIFGAAWAGAIQRKMEFAATVRPACSLHTESRWQYELRPSAANRLYIGATSSRLCVLCRHPGCGSTTDLIAADAFRSLLRGKKTCFQIGQNHSIIIGGRVRIRRVATRLECGLAARRVRKGRLRPLIWWASCYDILATVYTIGCSPPGEVGRTSRLLF